MKDIIDLFWDRIDVARKKKNLTLEKLALQSNIKPAQIRLLRCEKRYPKVIDLLSISKCIDVSVDFLLTGQEDSNLTETMKYIRDHKEAELIIKSLMKDESLLPLYEAIAYREIQKSNIETKKEKEA